MCTMYVGWQRKWQIERGVTRVRDQTHSICDLCAASMEMLNIQIISFCIRVQFLLRSITANDEWMNGIRLKLFHHCFASVRVCVWVCAVARNEFTTIKSGNNYSVVCRVRVNKWRIYVQINNVILIRRFTNPRLTSLGFYSDTKRIFGDLIMIIMLIPPNLSERNFIYQ